MSSPFVPGSSTLVGAFAEEAVVAARNERELLELFATHGVFPHLGDRFDCADAARALRHVADGRAVGTVVLDVPRRGAGGGSRQ